MIQDYNLQTNVEQAIPGFPFSSYIVPIPKQSGPIEVIDEFPFFSYYLADLHPHVLAMPFVMLVMALALNLYLHGAQESFSKWGMWAWIRQGEFWITSLAVGRAGLFQHLGFSNLRGAFQRGFYPGARPAGGMEVAAAAGGLYQDGDFVGNCRICAVYPLLYWLFLSSGRDFAQHGIFHPRGEFLDHVWIFTHPAGDLAAVAASKYGYKGCFPNRF